jgi:hypothetical protein
MRTYWTRILLGALGVFAVGIIVVTLARRGAVRVHHVMHGSGPINIPLAFIPFQLNGNQLGTLDRVTIYRETPTKVSSLQLEVKLIDSLVAEGLQGCRLAANFDDGGPGAAEIPIRSGSFAHGGFRCLPAGETPGLVEFGRALFRPGDVTVPLFLTHSLVEDLRRGDFRRSPGPDTSLTVEQADSAAAAAGRLLDSIAQRSTRLADSLRGEGSRRVDSAERVLRRVADSLRAH